MIAAFTAESGNDGQSSVFAMATILLCHTASYYFANDWKSLLADYGITTFHATDFYGPRGEFRGWAKDRRALFLPDLAMSLNNLANRQSEVGQRAEALETAREAVSLYRQLHDSHGETFADPLAKALGTISGVLSQLNQYSDAVSSLAEGLRTILPETERYPQAHLPLCLSLARAYFAATEAADIAPDNELLSELLRIVGPHLPQTNSGEPQND